MTDTSLLADTSTIRPTALVPAEPADAEDLRDHEGTIRLENLPGDGATFVLELPLLPGRRGSEGSR